MKSILRLLFGIFVLAQPGRSAPTTFGTSTTTAMPIEPTTEPSVDPAPTKTNVIAQIRENDYQLMHGDDPPRYYETALELLQSANNSIDEMQFDGISFYDHEIVEVSEQIVEFCANSLTAMRLLDAGTFLVSGTEAIFPNVVRVYLEYDSLPDIQEIHRIYPAMTELTIDASHFRTNLVQVAQLLPLTPQLRKLDVSIAANSIIQAIQANLPHLEWLAISYDVTLPISRAVHFDSVRTLGLRVVKLTEGTVKAIPLTFGGLEAVVLKAASIDAQLTEWIRQNGDLKSVTLEQAVDAESMHRLAAALDQLPKLQCVSLTIDYKADLASILSHHLDGVENVTLTLDGIFRDAQQSLLDTLPKRWKVVDGWRNSGWQHTLVVAPLPQGEIEPSTVSEEAPSDLDEFDHVVSGSPSTNGPFCLNDLRLPLTLLLLARIAFFL